MVTILFWVVVSAVGVLAVAGWFSERSEAAERSRRRAEAAAQNAREGNCRECGKALNDGERVGGGDVCFSCAGRDSIRALPG